MNTRIALAAAIVALALSLAGCESRPRATAEDEERERTANWKELEVPPPAFPKDADLVEARIGLSAHRYLVDASTLRIDSDGIVRYVLVLRTSGGARNVSYEGLRCSSGEKRVYATGRNDGSWQPSRAGWEQVRINVPGEYQSDLLRGIFCDVRATVPSRAIAIHNLRSGGLGVQRN